jgi:MFS superfamily sulfate permease-like transporter
VLVLGIAIGIVTFGLPAVGFTFPLVIVVPTPNDFFIASGELVLPQIPLTIGNAILATALLAGDLYQRPVAPKRLSFTIGLMNLTSVPFGGFPMCHGAGGLAAQYRFGARGAAANTMAGLVLIGIALFFSSPDLIALLPTGIYGALLVFVAIELGRHALTAGNSWIAVAMAATALLFGITVAFVLGILLAYLWRGIAQHRSAT